MAITKWLARDGTRARINTGTSGSPVWTPIGGIESVQHTPSTERAVTTDMDSAGHPEHMVAERGDEWTMSGFHLEDVATGDRDLGQAAVETLALGMGLSSLDEFQIVSPGGNTITFTASAEIKKPQGGKNEAAKWEVVLTVSGNPVYA